jgi:hypothetical protein
MTEVHVLLCAILIAQILVGKKLYSNHFDLGENAGSVLTLPAFHFAN